MLISDSFRELKQIFLFRFVLYEFLLIFEAFLDYEIEPKIILIHETYISTK